MNVKVVVAAFNQEKALVGAFSVIVKTDCGTDGSFYSTTQEVWLRPRGREASVRCARRGGGQQHPPDSPEEAVLGEQSQGTIVRDG